MEDDDRAKYLFLSLLQARVGSSLVSHLGNLSPEAVLRTPVAELAGRAKISEKASRAFEELQRSFDPDRMQDRLATRGIEVLTPVDEAFPRPLRSIPDPPPALFVNGAVPDTVSVALVGSRKASATGIETARALGLALSERGVCVVSGLALGVDAAAHEGAVEVGGLTVGVLGCGIDVVYPRRNRALFESVRRHGALVSEYALGEAPLAWRFPARNRIIAGLAGTVVVVEAPEHSGALITARHALDAGRDVWAVPGPPGVRECRGSNGLLSDGAGVLWDIPEFVDAVAREHRVPAAGGASAGVQPLPSGLEDTEAAVLCGVGFEPMGVDAVAKRSGVEMPGVLTALALLELKGFVRRDGVGSYARRAVP
ncbi:MAG: DNA-processing protein DprA [Actinomycetota bacterium]|nr:DNA-protecting protein DprA [Rubrobacteraceae bacterium]MDQ3184297.1 DNA-processing protein DprA [Actinomycetota bacterium]MDQ3496216.1 DNA-processing protein DprA [Actinomycetota bacterium]